MSDKIFAVAVDGPSGAGKSTLAAFFASQSSGSTDQRISERSNLLLARSTVSL